jgi:hypothetical protein
MSKVPETYLYEVRNIGRVIKLDCGVEISTPRSLYLTKDDVKKCLQTAYVFRRFAQHGSERVTIANLDRMHQATYISEQDWKNNTIVDTTVEVTKEPEAIETVVVDDTTPEVVSETVEESFGVTIEDSEGASSIDSDTVKDIVSVEEDALTDESVNETEDESDNAESEEDGNVQGVVAEPTDNQTTPTNTVKYNYKKHKKNH